MPIFNVHGTPAAFVLVVTLSAAAAICDVRTRRIPNVLVVVLFLAGLALNALAGPRFAFTDVAVTFAALLLGTLAFSLRLIGGGDVKLFAAAAGALNYPAAFVFLLLTLFAGGVLGAAIAATRGCLVQTALNVRGMALPLLAGVRPAPMTAGTSMPYALAICGGALLTLLTGGTLPHVRF